MSIHDHNTQVRRHGRCETCADAPQREADRKAANPGHVTDTRHAAAPFPTSLRGGDLSDPEDP